MPDAEVYDLEELDVLTVGLVGRGANKEEFFLLKAEDAEEDGPMSDEYDLFEELIELEDQTPEGSEPGAWQKLLGIVGRAVLGDKANKMTPKAAQAVKDALELLNGVKGDLGPQGAQAIKLLAGLSGYGYPQPASKVAVSIDDEPEGDEVMDDKDRIDKADTPKDVAKPEPVAEPEASAALPPDVLEKLDVLEKARTDLTARLEKAEAEAEAEREARHGQEYLEKARQMVAVPAETGQLAEQMAWLSKQDPERSEWWETLLRTVDHQLVDSELFREHGTSRVPESEPLAKARRAVLESDISFRDALLTLSTEEQARYLADQQRAAKER